MSNLSGTWYNELGSTMTLTADGSGGLTGKYNSAVGDAQDFYILAGRYDAAPPANEGVSVAWTVAYRNSFRNAHSTAGWSGQYFASGPERILTHWLLTSSSDAQFVWSSTNLGTDTFTRTKPSAADIDKAKAHRVSCPHPEHIIELRSKFVGRAE